MNIFINITIFVSTRRRIVWIISVFTQGLGLGRNYINSQCRTLLSDQNKIHENLKALIKSMFLHHPARYETVPVSIASYFSRRINSVYKL